MKKLNKRALYVHDILRWADAYREATGRWPTKESGVILQAPFETWARVDCALRTGTRSLDGGSSLAQLLAAHRGVRNIRALPDLSVPQILAWADAHFQATGYWPTAQSGKVAGTDEKWANVAQALHKGLRGLPAGRTLAQLLAADRGVRNRKNLPPMSEPGILVWADAHFAQTGMWPDADSGPIPESPGDTWMGVENALRRGDRTLPGGSSLAWLLADKRGVGDYYRRTPLSVAQILDWADQHVARTGQWPTLDAGPVVDAPAETWKGLNSALRRGLRNLPAGRSLAQLLIDERGVRKQSYAPDLTRRQILVWADAHFARTGTWPNRDSGPVLEAPGETWSAIDAALYSAGRGLRGRTTLARFLARHRGRRCIQGQPPLTKRMILAWADAHFARHGRWPRCKDGVIPEANGETWASVDHALRHGLRRQPGGSSLTRLLARMRGVRNQADLPPLSVDQILGWADAHHRRTGRWPKANSGRVFDAPDHSWNAIDMALREGSRTLTGGSSLARLLEQEHGVRNKKNLPPLTGKQIMDWAMAHYDRTGRWPTKTSGPVAEAPGETWGRIDAALRRGSRTLPGKSSLAQLLDAFRGDSEVRTVPVGELMARVI